MFGGLQLLMAPAVEIIFERIKYFFFVAKIGIRDVVRFYFFFEGAGRAVAAAEYGRDSEDAAAVRLTVCYFRRRKIAPAGAASFDSRSGDGR